MAKKTKPVVFGDETSEPGTRYTEKMSERDVRQTQKLGSYIPGYTEQQEANDLSKAKQFASGGEIHGLSDADKKDYYERFGTDPEPLPYAFKAVRTSDHRGEENITVTQNVWNFRRQGWVPAKADDFKEGGKFHKLGWEMPPGFRETPDGTLRRMDTTLYYIEGEKYRRIEAEKRTPESQKMPVGPDERLYEEREGDSRLVDSADARSV